MHWNFVFTRSDGRSFALGPPPCRIVAVEGADSGRFDYATAENPGVQGVIVTGRRIPPRELEITGDLAYPEREALRERMTRFFSPALSGVAESDRNGTRRRIGYEVRSLHFFQSSLGAPVTYTLRLFCPSPYWEHGSSYGKNLAAAIPLLGFPLVIPNGQAASGRGSRRLVTGYTQKDRVTFLGNGGDTAVGLRAVFTATRGQVTDPWLRLKDTGEQLLVHTALEKLERLELSTLPRQKQVVRYGADGGQGENIFHLLDRSSVFFQVPVGGGQVEYGAAEGYSNLDLRLYYTPLYLGI